MSQPRKKLIEVSMPLEAINVASARAKKKAPKGYPTSFHKYWAQRPLAACRAVIFGQLVDDPSSWPDKFPTDVQQDAERERLHQVIRDMLDWPAVNTADQGRWELALDAARWEIARSVAWALGDEPPPRGARDEVLLYLARHAPEVRDPFAGGGSIPLEAQRLGLRAFGSDLNPLSVMISKALVEIPPKFSGLAPLAAIGRGDLLREGWRGAQGLAEDVRHYGAWMREEAQKRVGALYPKALLPDGVSVPVVAWLWARTVRSPDPSARGAMVPLASSFVLSSKPGREAIVRVRRDPGAEDGWRFEVQQGDVSASDLSGAKLGTKSANAAAFVCALSGSPVPRDYVQSEGKAGRLGTRLMAIVAERERSRAYLSPTSDAESTARRAGESTRPSDARAGFLSGLTPTRAMITGGVCSAYGLSTWGHLFTDRQLVGLTTFSDLIGEVRAKAFAEATRGFAERGLPTDDRRLADGGRGAAAYADAVATYLAFAVDRMAEYGSAGASWLPKDSAIRSTFARQALPMMFDFCEANYLAKSSAAIDTCVNVVADAIERTPASVAAKIYQWSAQKPETRSACVVSTDPPYYDNIAYSDLSDFFYVWLRRSLGDIWPGLFRRLQTPKDEELVATPFRAPDHTEMARRVGNNDDPILLGWDKLSPKDRAEREFMFGMTQALAVMRAESAPDVPLAIYYAFKQSEKSEDGVSSAGWASFLQAVMHSGLMVDGTWPMRTESEERLVGNNANALASSIVLVCRPRPDDAKTTTRREFVAELRKELPEALSKMRAAGVHPVDVPQSALGPGMAVFTKYTVVREADDSPMSVSRAITLINQVRGEIAHADSGDLDAPTRFALDWFEAYGWGAKDAGEAIKLGMSYDLSVKGLLEAGVLTTDRGDARLVRRSDMPTDWRPSTDRFLTAWELVQALNRALNDGGGVRAAAALLVEARELSTAALWLTGRLFALAEDRRMTDEALGWGRLAEAWDAIEAAVDRTDGPAAAAAQPDLF